MIPSEVEEEDDSEIDERYQKKNKARKNKTDRDEQIKHMAQDKLDKQESKSETEQTQTPEEVEKQVGYTCPVTSATLTKSSNVVKWQSYGVVSLSLRR